ncbi:MAG: hypothetical protein ACM31C_01505, partial [Acidobacteriota bacterium]
AAMFAVAELARDVPPATSPLPALGAALVAGVLDPSYVALAAVAGARVAFGRRPASPRPRWTLALPLAGVLASALAVIAALATAGLLGELWRAWAGAGTAAPLADVAARAGDALGPLAIVAAVAGTATCIAGSRFGAAAVLAITLGAAAVAVRTGSVAPALPIASSLACGVAVARLAALVRHPVGQACVGALAAFVLLVAPAWPLVAASR